MIHKVYEPSIRARLGAAAHFCEVVVPKLRTTGRYRPAANENNGFADEGFSEQQLMQLDGAEESVEAREQEISKVRFRPNVDGFVPQTPSLNF